MTIPISTIPVLLSLLFLWLAFGGTIKDSGHGVVPDLLGAVLRVLWVVPIGFVWAAYFAFLHLFR